MKILVCMKQVPQKDAPLKLNESGTWIREDVSYEVNEPDAYALEEALRQKAQALEATGGDAPTTAGALVPWICDALLSNHSVKAYGRDLSLGPAAALPPGPGSPSTRRCRATR